MSKKIVSSKVTVSTSEMEKFESNLEGNKGIQNLCEIANLLGYRDVLQSGFRSDGKNSYCESDLIEMLKDNSFLIEALVDAIRDNLFDVKEFYDEEDELPSEVVSKIKKYCKFHKSEYIEYGEEVNTTRLAEDIANEYEIFTDADCEIHSEVFEIVNYMCCEGGDEDNEDTELDGE